MRPVEAAVRIRRLTKLATQDAAEKIAAALAQHEDYVTVLFNNAGIMGGAAEPPKQLSGDAFKKSYSSLTDEDFHKWVVVWADIRVEPTLTVCSHAESMLSTRTFTSPNRLTRTEAGLTPGCAAYPQPRTLLSLERLPAAPGRLEEQSPLWRQV